MECGICYTDNELLKTNCEHVFCSKCLTTWMEIKNNCPVCRGFISYTVKISKQCHNTERRITRSMTKPQREHIFYNKFKALIIEITDRMAADTMDHISITVNINKLIKLCLKNYIIMSPSIYKLTLEILKTETHHINNRDIIRKRLIELKPHINYSPTIDM